MGCNNDNTHRAGRLTLHKTWINIIGSGHSVPAWPAHATELEDCEQYIPYTVPSHGAGNHELSTINTTCGYMHSHRAVTSTIHIYVYIYHKYVRVPQSVMQWYPRNNAHTAQAPFKQQATLDKAPRHTRSLRRATTFRLTTTKHTSADWSTTTEYTYIYIRSLLTIEM